MRCLQAGIVASLLLFSVGAAEAEKETALRVVSVDFTVENTATFLEVTSVHRHADQLVVIVRTVSSDDSEKKVESTDRSVLVAARASAELRVVRYLKSDRWHEQIGDGPWGESEGPPDLDPQSPLYGGDQASHRGCQNRRRRARW